LDHRLWPKVKNAKNSLQQLKETNKPFLAALGHLRYLRSSVDLANEINMISGGTTIVYQSGDAIPTNTDRGPFNETNQCLSFCPLPLVQ
jgi:hypothetical protein